MHKLPAYDPTWALYVAAPCAFGAWLNVVYRMFHVMSRMARVQDLVRKHAPQMIEEIAHDSFHRNQDGKVVPLSFNESQAVNQRVADFIDSDELEDVPALRDAKARVRDAQELREQAVTALMRIWLGSFLFVFIVWLVAFVSIL